MSIRNPLLFDDGLKPSRGTATTQYPEGLFRKGLDSLTLAAFESALGFYGVDEQGFFQSMIDRLIHHHRISQSSNGHSISRLNIPFRLGWNNHPEENGKIRRLDEIADFCFKTYRFGLDQPENQKHPPRRIPILRDCNALRLVGIVLC